MLNQVLLAGAIVAVVAVIALIVARTTALRAGALEHDVSDLKDELGRMGVHLNTLMGHTAKLADQSAKLSEHSAKLADQNAKLADQSAKLSDHDAKLADHDAKLADHSAKLSDHNAELADQSAKLSDQCATRAEAAAIQSQDQIVPSRQAFDPMMLSQMSTEELGALAESIVSLKPLEPCPGWVFGANWENSDPMFRARRQIWEEARARQRYVPITIPWHEGTRVRMRLGSSCTFPLFVGGRLDPNEFSFLDGFLKPGMTFIDAGANDGLFTIFAAKRLGETGDVWAFEPSRREFEELKSNLKLNGLKARLFSCALAEQAGEAEFKVGDFGNEGLNTLGEFAYEVGQGSQYPVELKRLDDLATEYSLPRLDLLKLDVEGAELRVLQGATGTLRRCRPVVLFEVLERALGYQGTSGDELLAFLRELRYSIYVFDEKTGLPTPADPDLRSENMLALPEDARRS